MTNDEKQFHLDHFEEELWRLMASSAGVDAKSDCVAAIERCQRIRKAIPKDRERYANESPHRAGVE